jgi:hypothetical protein
VASASVGVVPGTPATIPTVRPMKSPRLRQPSIPPQLPTPLSSMFAPAESMATVTKPSCLPAEPMDIDHGRARSSGSGLAGDTRSRLGSQYSADPLVCQPALPGELRCKCCLF